MVKRSTAAALDAAFSALADPTRRAIVARLAAVEPAEKTVGEIAKPLPMSLPAVSKHLRILEGAGLVARRRQGRRHLLRAVPAALDPPRDWIARQRAFWNDRLEALGRYLEGDEEIGTARKAPAAHRGRKRN